MYRLKLLASMFVVALLTSGFLMGEDKKAEDKKTEKEPVVVKSQLPRYFKQLGLSDAQRKDIYKIRGKYQEKIEELQRQIAALKEQEKTDLDNILSDAQKARLKELRAGKAK